VFDWVVRVCTELSEVEIGSEDARTSMPTGVSRFEAITDFIHSVLGLTDPMNLVAKRIQVFFNETCTAMRKFESKSTHARFAEVIEHVGRLTALFRDTEGRNWGQRFLDVVYAYQKDTA
jgi:hypothetical protein